MTILPTGTAAPITTLEDFVVLMYGAPKVGKTTACSRAPNGKEGEAVFLTTEPGTLALGCATVNIGSYADMQAALGAMEGGESHEFRAVVVDTVDLLYPMYTAQVAKELGVADVGEPSLYGRGWRILKTRWISDLARLRSLKNSKGEKVMAIFISHERTTPIIERRGKKDVDTGLTYTTSDLSGVARKILHSSVDFILRAEFTKEGERVIRTQPGTTETGQIEAGCRGRLDHPMPTGFPLDFDSFRGAFSEAFPASPTPPTPPKSRRTK